MSNALGDSDVNVTNHMQYQQPTTPLQRVRSHFHQCPVVYSDDPLALPQPVFPVTDFISAVPSSVIEDIADAFLDTLAAAPRQLDRPEVMVGVANRSVGAIVHELSRRTGLPYTLANWFPPGTAGETLVCKTKGFGNLDGAVYVNGLSSGHRVLLVVDMLRSGKNLADMLRACSKAGCTVVGCLCLCEIMEYPGRETVRGFFDAHCPLHVLVQVSARGERTKVLGATNIVPSMPKAASISRLCVEDVLAPPSTALRRSQRLFGYTASAAMDERQQQYENSRTSSAEGGPRQSAGVGTAAGTNGALSRQIDNNKEVTYVPLTRDELRAKLKRVSDPFYNVPVVVNKSLAYPYCFWQLTDFVPLMTPDVIEDMADLIVREANFGRADVIVSEADRGGAPLAVAVSRRTGKPFVLASWTTQVDSQVSDCTSVGFSGQGRFFISGVKNGERVIFIDDMLSSGGTGAGILESLARCGAVTLEAIFVGEKLHKAQKLTPEEPDDVTDQRLPIRGGYKRLVEAFPDVVVTTLVQLTAYGTKTAPPIATVG